MIAILQKISRRWRRLLSLVAGLLLAAFLTLNVLAYRHAHFMLHYQANTESETRGKFVVLSENFTKALRGERIPRPCNSATPSDFGIEYETYYIPIDRNITLQGWWLPREHSRACVVLFHGHAAAKSILLPEASFLHKKGYSCFLVDLRGSGGSDGTQTSIGYHEAIDVAITYKYIKKQFGESKIILYGQSMGGAAILRSIHVHCITPDAVVLESVFNRLSDTVHHRVRTMGLPAFPIAPLLVFWGGMQCDYSGFQHNPVEYARSVTCPALVLHGAEDPWVTVNESRQIYENLDGPKQFVLFEKTGHESCFHRDPETWAVNVEAFLNRIAGPQNTVTLAN